MPQRTVCAYAAGDRYLLYTQIARCFLQLLHQDIHHCLLQSGCRNVTCIEQRTGVSQSCVSQHLQKLRAAGIVTAERQGNEMFYHVASRPAAEVLASLFQETEESYVL